VSRVEARELVEEAEEVALQPAAEVEREWPAHVNKQKEHRAYPMSSCSPYYYLAFTRYCHNQYCMVCGIQKGGSVGERILRNGCAIALQ